jgi:hypothetical protein
LTATAQFNENNVRHRMLASIVVQGLGHKESGYKFDFRTGSRKQD